MTGEKLTIELLYFEDCPSWKYALDILNVSLEKLGITEQVKLLLVETQEAAEAFKFTGSPMIKVNGEDLFPTDQQNFALGCRVFQTPHGYQGWPTAEMIETQIVKMINQADNW